MPTLWQIELLGTLRATGDSGSVTRFRTQKAAWLLAFLAHQSNHTHSRDSLIERLWPESTLDSGRNNLSISLNSLRRLLEPPGISSGSVLIADRTYVRLNPDSIVTDVAQFEERLHEAERAYGTAAEEALLVLAADRYGGPLLPGHYDTWATTERERLANLYLGVLRRLIKHGAAARDWERALNYAWRAVQADPLGEEFHRSLMRLYVAVGRPTAALQQYDELQSQLRSALNAAPASATRELAARIAAELGTDRLTVPRPAQTLDQESGPQRTEPSRPSALTDFATQSADVPGSITRFFGRETEIEEVLKALAPDAADGPHLVTVTGAGGLGKTRLALEAAHRLNALYANPIRFVPLAEVNRPDRLYSVLRDALNLPRAPSADPLVQIASALAGQSTLIVLDNFEQLVPAATPLIAELLRAAPTLRLLVTSRRLLGLQGEKEFALPPLPTPNAAGTPERLLEFPSVQLFVDRAQARQTGFQITRKNAPALATLCHRLEGVPLAIEIAASWAQMLSPDQMLSQLDRRFEFLVSQNTNVPLRHQTLRAVIDSSFGMMEPALKALFTNLSVFRGGFNLTAVCAIWGLPERDALDQLAQLRSRSLITCDSVDLASSAEMRYRMLESLREYAAEQPSPVGRDELARKHALYYLEYAERARGHLNGREPAPWLDALEIEHDNLRAALAYYAGTPEGVIPGLRLAAALGPFWKIRGHRVEGLAHLDAALARVGADATDCETRQILYDACCATGHLLQGAGEYERAHGVYSRALDIARRLERPQDEANSLKLLGNIAYSRRHIAEAEALYTASLTLYRRLNRTHAVAHLLDSLGSCALALGDAFRALELHAEALPIMREAGDRLALVITLSNLGNAAQELKQFDLARSMLEESLDISRALGSRESIAFALRNLAFVAIGQGDAQSAERLLAESLAIFRELRLQTSLSELLVAFAQCADLRNDGARTVRLIAAADALSTRLGVLIGDVERQEHDRLMAVAHLALGPSAVDAARMQGRLMTADQACDFALNYGERAEKSETDPNTAHSIHRSEILKN
jgi:predicted ATPase/DNA-binding SARP family transcriptional activator